MPLVCMMLLLIFFANFRRGVFLVVQETKDFYLGKEDQSMCPKTFKGYYLSPGTSGCLPPRGDHRHIRSHQNPQSVCFLVELANLNKTIIISEELEITCN